MTIHTQTQAIPPDLPNWAVQYRMVRDSITIDPRINILEAPWILAELNSLRGLLVGVSFFPVEGEIELRTHEGMINAQGTLTLHLPPGKEEVWKNQAQFTIALIAETAQRLIAGCLVKYPQTAVHMAVQYKIKLSQDKPPGSLP